MEVEVRHKTKSKLSLSAINSGFDKGSNVDATGCQRFHPGRLPQELENVEYVQPPS